MESNPRGVVLIVSNNKVKKDRERRETKHDCKKLEYLFTLLGFMVLVKENLKAKEMLTEFESFAENELLAQVDCMVLAVLSYGTTDNVICGIDGKGIDVMKSMIPIFSAAECPNLRSKPKMFICNACRGDKPGKSIKIVKSKKKKVSRKKQADNLQSDEDNILCFSTFPGSEFHMNPKEGTWFIHEFVKVFEEQSHHTHVLDMLTKIKKIVSQKYTGPASGSTCVQTSTLTEPWYLHPSLHCRIKPLSDEFLDVTEL